MLASPRPFPGAVPTAACSQLPGFSGGPKAGTLRNLMVPHPPPEQFPAGRVCPRFPHAPQAGQGLAGQGWGQQDVPTAAVRNEVTVSTSLGLCRVTGREANFNQLGGKCVNSWSFPHEQCGASTPWLPGGGSDWSSLGGILYFRDAVQIHISCP